MTLLGILVQMIISAFRFLFGIVITIAVTFWPITIIVLVPFLYVFVKSIILKIVKVIGKK